MKYVVDCQLMNIVQVEDNFEECNVTGQWFVPEEFCDETGKSARTNCLMAYYMPYNEMKELGETTRIFKQSEMYRNLHRTAVIINSQLATYNHAMPIQEMIDALIALRDANPQARLVVTESGYYADRGGIADIFVPGETNWANVYAIGNSTQNY